jgi:hypothetical protein
MSSQALRATDSKSSQASLYHATNEWSRGSNQQQMLYNSIIHEGEHNLDS